MSKIKLFISQPMRGKTAEEIICERNAAIQAVRESFGEEVAVLDTYFEGGEQSPLEYLGKSITLLSKADLAYFCNGWRQARGCHVEHECAMLYEIPVVYAELMVTEATGMSTGFVELRADACIHTTEVTPDGN